MATDSEPPPSAGSPRRRRKLSAIMMADVSNFSRMMGDDENSTVDLIQDFHKRVTELVERFEGRVVDTAGDSVFGEFDSVVNAMTCACRIQAEQAEANARRGPNQRVESRIGVHLGDVITEDYRVYGDGVNIAARLEPLAEPGGICISEAVYAQIRSKLDLKVEDMGLKELKNIEHPIRIYKVPPAGPAREPSPAPAPQPLPSVSAVAQRQPVGAGFLVLLAIGGFLLASPLFLFSTAGIFPTAGAILTSVAVGRFWGGRSAGSRNLLLALGLGLASGAIWTDWSRITNALFVLAGMIVAAVGIGAGRHKTSDRE
jgi:class 3 adenylate cyclase